MVDNQRERFFLPFCVCRAQLTVGWKCVYQRCWLLHCWGPTGTVSASMLPSQFRDRLILSALNSSRHGCYAYSLHFLLSGMEITSQLPWCNICEEVRLYRDLLRQWKSSGLKTKRKFSFISSGLSFLTPTALSPSFKSPKLLKKNHVKSLSLSVPTSTTLTIRHQTRGLLLLKRAGRCRATHR